MRQLVQVRIPPSMRARSPPPPPPPRMCAALDSAARESRVAAQIAELPRTMLCDMCGAVAYQLTARMQVADTRISTRRGRPLP